MATIAHKKEDIAGIETALGLFCMDARFLGNAQYKETLLQTTGLKKIYCPQTAGPDAELSEGVETTISWAVSQAAWGRRLADIKLMLVSGHGGCARHSVSDEQHRVDTWKAAERMARELDDTWLVMPVFIPIIGQAESGEDLWGVEIVTPEQAMAV